MAKVAQQTTDPAALGALIPTDEWLRSEVTTRRRFFGTSRCRLRCPSRLEIYRRHVALPERSKLLQRLLCSHERTSLG